MSVRRVQHGVRHGERLAVAEKRLLRGRGVDAEKMSRLADARPLYYLFSRVRFARVQGTQFGIEDRQFGSSSRTSRDTGCPDPEAQEGGSDADRAVPVLAGVEQDANQKRNTRMQLSTR